MFRNSLHQLSFFLIAFIFLILLICVSIGTSMLRIGLGPQPPSSQELKSLFQDCIPLVRRINDSQATRDRLREKLVRIAEAEPSTLDTASCAFVKTYRTPDMADWCIMHLVNRIAFRVPRSATAFPSAPLAPGANAALWPLSVARDGKLELRNGFSILPQMRPNMVGEMRFFSKHLGKRQRPGYY
jgi:hypothetical protein